MRTKARFVTLFFVMLAVIFIKFIYLPFPGFLENKKRLALNRIEKAGGLEKANKEVERIFDEVFYTAKEGPPVLIMDKKKCPIIASLGESVRLSPADENSPAYIGIRYGSHFHSRWLYIFDPRKHAEIWEMKDPKYIQIADNIYVFYSDNYFHPTVFAIELMGAGFLILILVASMIRFIVRWMRRKKGEEIITGGFSKTRLRILLFFGFITIAFCFYHVLPALFTPGFQKRLALSHIEKAGGLEKLNDEIEKYFNGPSRGKKENLTKWGGERFPTISSLGNITIIKTGKGSPDQIWIRYGTFYPRMLYLFDPKKDAKMKDSSYIQISKNIYAYYGDSIFSPGMMGKELILAEVCLILFVSGLIAYIVRLVKKKDFDK